MCWHRTELALGQVYPDRCVAAVVLPLSIPDFWHGAGLTTAKGHMPYILFTLLDVLQAFPSQVRIYAHNCQQLLAVCHYRGLSVS